MTDALSDSTAIFVEVEGEIERHGGLLVFKVLPDTIRTAQ